MKAVLIFQLGVELLFPLRCEPLRLLLAGLACLVFLVLAFCADFVGVFSVERFSAMVSELEVDADGALSGVVPAESAGALSCALRHVSNSA